MIDSLRPHEIPGRVAVVSGNGGLAKLVVTSPVSRAEIYAHGAQVTHFQKSGEPPLLFLSPQSWFAPGKPIRGGVPICFPWFGNRDGEPSHGFARLLEWPLIHSAVESDGAVTLQFALPVPAGREAWKNLRTEFRVIVGDALTLELTAANDGCADPLEIENCLHTYFHVGDIEAVSITGLRNTGFLDFAGDGGGERKEQSEAVLRIPAETNRTYLDTAAAVEIRDDQLRRRIRVEKRQSQSTVVWNPWTTQKLPDDFAPADYRRMVCVESGNVRHNKILLAPGQSSTLQVVLRTFPF